MTAAVLGLVLELFCGSTAPVADDTNPVISVNANKKGNGARFIDLLPRDVRMTRLLPMVCHPAKSSNAFDVMIPKRDLFVYSEVLPSSEVSYEELLLRFQRPRSTRDVPARSGGLKAFGMRSKLRGNCKTEIRTE